MSTTKNLEQTQPAFLNRQELSSRLGVSEATTRRLEKIGAIKGFKVGAASRYEWDTVINGLKTQSQDAPQSHPRQTKNSY
jgi:hypothetical protein